MYQHRLPNYCFKFWKSNEKKNSMSNTNPTSTKNRFIVNIVLSTKAFNENILVRSR